MTICIEVLIELFQGVPATFFTEKKLVKLTAVILKIEVVLKNRVDNIE